MALAPYSRQKRKASHHYLTVAVVIVLVLAAALLIRFLYDEVVHHTEPTRDYLFEPYAVAAEESSREGENLLQSVPEDSIAYQLNTKMTYQLRKESLDLMAGNPAESTYYLRVRLIGEDGAQLYESGMLKPGSQLKTISLAEAPAEDIYSVTVEFDAYDIATLELLGTAECTAEIQVI